MADQTFSHSQVVRCPIAEAPKRLADHFQVESIEKPLCLDSAIANRVRLTLHPQSQLGDGNLLFDTHWSPMSGVPVPSFHGEFLVRHFGRDLMLMIIGGRIEHASEDASRGSTRPSVRREAIACARHFLSDIQRAVETPLHRLW